MKRLKSEPAWKGYCAKEGGENQTELQSYEDCLLNTTQASHEVSVDGAVELSSLSWSFVEDASVPAIKQKLIDLEVIPELVIEDVKADKEKTVLRRLTMTSVTIIEVKVAINEDGRGVVTVRARCLKAKWERKTPDGPYTEATWNPNGL